MKYRHDQRLKRRWPWVVAVVAVVVVAAAIAAWLLFVPRSPVPDDVKKAVSFPIYYPEQSKLPSGYTLDTKSFTASDQVAMYIITYGSDQRLIVSVQKRPPEDEIAYFYKNTIPIHKDVVTVNGTAAIGAVGQQSITSLPTNDQSWLIIMGPPDVNKDELSRVLQAMTKSN